LAKATYFLKIPPFLEVGYSKNFGVEFWLTTTLVFFLIQFGKNNIFKKKFHPF